MLRRGVVLIGGIAIGCGLGYMLGVAIPLIVAVLSNDPSVDTISPYGMYIGAVVGAVVGGLVAVGRLRRDP